MEAYESLEISFRSHINLILCKIVDVINISCYLLGLTETESVLSLHCAILVTLCTCSHNEDSQLIRDPLYVVFPTFSLPCSKTPDNSTLKPPIYHVSHHSEFSVLPCSAVANGTISHGYTAHLPMSQCCREIYLWVSSVNCTFDN